MEIITMFGFFKTKRIGGEIGGAVGNLLTPQQAEATQKVISKICKDMPARIPPAKKKGLFN